MAENIVENSIENEMQSSYIDYAMSVIVGRALPDARDGLKPAQRRILYAMYRLNNLHDQQTKKSARIVGEVIGKYHPHGDMAAYETLVRMAQDFSMNHMLVEGQGNMGSIDGDPPAAQRYTEVRLRKIAEEMLVDMDKEAVPFMPNFDNTETEPVVLPSKVPNLMINGSSGIAVGVATNILPHNLREVCSAIVAYLDNMEITPQELLNHVKGPDFPTGGIVFYDGRLIESYIKGRGSVTIRARVSIEKEKRGERIVINEIPYTVNKASLIEKIGNLVKEKVIEGIADLRDESDKKGIRISIELKANISPDYVLNTLYKHTQLQITMPVMNVAVLGNRLLNLNIRDMIKIFVEHRFGVVTNRTNYDLRIANQRKHIVDGLIIATEDIDNVVAIIRGSANSSGAKEALMAKYGITEAQAVAILDMKLSKLTNLEVNNLKAEKKELENSISYYNSVLGSKEKVYQIIRDETNEIAEKYGSDRKTAIETSELVEIENEDLIKDEDSIIILTKDGYMKRLPMDAYKNQGRGGRGVISIDLKEGDFVKQVVRCMTKDYLLVITSAGRVYWLKGYVVPEGGRYAQGKAAVNLISIAEGERIEQIINTRNFSGKNLIFATRRGRIKSTKAELFSRPRANGIRAIKLNENDVVVSVCLSAGGSNVFLATRNGKAIRFMESDLRHMGRVASGVRGIRLKPNDELVDAVVADPKKNIITITERGYGKATLLEKYRLQRRGGGGVINLKVTEKTGKVVRVLEGELDDNVIVFNSKGLSIRFSANTIRVTGRNASGVRLMRLEADAKVVDAQVVGKEM